MEIQFSSLKNETVIFIIPHTINAITIHVFKILYSIIPNYFQYSFDRYGLMFDSSIPFIKFQNYSQVHFKKRSFVIIKNKIDSIDINFIKVVKTD